MEPAWTNRNWGGCYVGVLGGNHLDYVNTPHNLYSCGDFVVSSDKE